MTRLSVLAAIAATAVVAAGCGSSSSSTSSSAPATSATATASSSAAPATSTSASAPVAGGSSTITSAADPSGALKFTTKTLTAKAGKVTVNFTNKAPEDHNFTVASADGKVVGATPTFSGGSKTVTLNLPPGTYTFYCSVPGHEAAGMKGTLTVN